jgi:hypothetical protein
MIMHRLYKDIKKFSLSITNASRNSRLVVVATEVVREAEKPEACSSPFIRA